MEIIPLSEYVLIKPLEHEDVTESGLVLPSNRDTEASNNGTVVKVGEKVENVKEGAKVLFKPYGFDEVTFEKQKYLIGKVENVMALLT